MKMRGEGLHWDNIGKEVGLPGYCCMVIAGETRGHRQTPQ
jgi:hypothetical protein